MYVKHVSRSLVSKCLEYNPICIYLIVLLIDIFSMFLLYFPFLILSLVLLKAQPSRLRRKRRANPFCGSMEYGG